MFDAIFSIHWHDLLLPGPSILEKMLRPALIYVALLLAFRVFARRGQAQATLFDFLIILLLSNVVQNAMIGDDNSILGALAGAAVLLLFSFALDKLTSGSDRWRRSLEGHAVYVVVGGSMITDRMRKLGISDYDVRSAIRKQGISRLADVAYAILELDGSISVIRTDDDQRPHDCLPADHELALFVTAR